MHGEDIPFGYGFWSLVVVNAGIFVLLALSYLTPVKRREWRSFGVFTAFVVALFTEMYGFPLTLYFMSGWLQSRFPEVDWFSHAAGHLLEMLFGWKANPHFGPFHMLSFVFIGGGFILTPLLSVVLKVPLGVAVGSGLCQMVGTATVAFLRHQKLKQGEPRFDVLMMGGSLLGVTAGAHVFEDDGSGE